VCAVCRVRRQCLRFALATRQSHGIWGGTTEDERRVHALAGEHAAQAAAGSGAR
jgi:WhiB family redox-sensing transcriptional regulator